jgi:hypothetical protein
MRNYWLRIAFGALAIFTVGMIGVTLAREGVGRVRNVVEGSGPITIPLGFVPFNLDGQKLGSVSRVVLLRDAPKQIAGVEVEIDLRDSTLARGLEGCRLRANFDEHSRDQVRTRPQERRFSPGVFSCLHSGDSAPEFQHFGRATFQPGNVVVPLLLPNDMVNDLKEGHFDTAAQDSMTAEDSMEAAIEARLDSISEAAEREADSITTAAEMYADSVVARKDRLIDSLQREGMRRADSTRRAAAMVSDSARRR